MRLLVQQAVNLFQQGAFMETGLQIVLNVCDKMQGDYQHNARQAQLEIPNKHLRRVRCRSSVIAHLFFFFNLKKYFYYINNNYL